MHVPVGSVQVGCNNSETELLSPYLLLKVGFLHCQHFFIAELSKQVLIFVQAKAFQPNRDLCERERERERGVVIGLIKMHTHALSVNRLINIMLVET